MSITDGQVVMRAGRDPATGGLLVDPQLSVSRIGGRAYAPALEALAVQVCVWCVRVCGGGARP